MLDTAKPNVAGTTTILRTWCWHPTMDEHYHLRLKVIELLRDCTEGSRIGFLSDGWGRPTQPGGKTFPWPSVRVCDVLAGGGEPRQARMDFVYCCLSLYIAHI